MYDIAVIGAGPAGATFARLAADGKRKIVLIDGQTESRKKPCGGLLAPDAQKVLAHFDLVLPKDVLADPQIFSVKTIDLCTRQVRYYPRCYLNMDLYAFDKWLLSLVPEDVKVLSGRCIKMERQEGGFVICVSTGQTIQEIQCREIAGADGAGSLVRKTFFPEKKMMQYASIQQWFRHEGKTTPFYSCIFDPKTSESCSWLIYKDEYVIYGGCFAPKHCRQGFEEQKKRVCSFFGQDFGAPVKTEACLANRPKKYGDFETGANGVYLIGEAAGFISASSFEGISSAIHSASLLAEAFLECGGGKETAERYRRKAVPLKLKLYLKTKKRWFMYTPWVRKLIMKSGLDSIQVQQES